MMSASGGEFKKLLLPPPRVWETIWSALKGLSAVATRSEDREALEAMLTSGIINDTVLAGSRHNSATSPGGTGSVLVFSLFDSLHHNPLWKQHAFDPREFLRGARPALTNFMELLHLLRQQEMEKQLIKQQVAAEAEKGDQTTENKDGMKMTVSIESEDNSVEEKIIYVEDLLPGSANNEHSWSNLAAKDPDSLAGAVSKMTTPAFLDHIYFATVVDAFLTSQFSSSSGLPKFVPGSTKIEQVAILRARAMKLEPDLKEDFDVFEASDPEFQSKLANRPVAAQIDVLFEVKHRHWEDATAASISDDSSTDKGNDQDTTEEESLPNERSSKKVLVEQSQLGVAVLEGYLFNPKLKEGLRWRIPLLREPWEFPNLESYGAKTIISEEEAGGKQK